MEIKIQIDEINYSDVAMHVLPILGEQVATSNSAIAKLVSAIVQLPPHLLVSIFDTISTKQKNDIVSSFVSEYQPLLIESINNLSHKNSMGISIAKLSVDANLKISAQVGHIDYPRLVHIFLPMIKQHLLAPDGPLGLMRPVLRPVIIGATADIICNTLDRFVPNKDAFLASLISKNQQVLISHIEETARKQNIYLKIGSIFVEA